MPHSFPTRNGGGAKNEKCDEHSLLGERSDPHEDPHVRHDSSRAPRGELMRRECSCSASASARETFFMVPRVILLLLRVARVLRCGDFLVPGLFYVKPYIDEGDIITESTSCLRACARSFAVSTQLVLSVRAAPRCARIGTLSLSLLLIKQNSGNSN